MPTPPTRRATLATSTVLAVALAAVAAVWLLSAWWSFAEQTRLAEAEGFAHPAVLPWTLDGLACALALVALAAALDGRGAVAARLGVIVAVAASVWTNTRGVALRVELDGARVSPDALRLAAIAPVSAVVAFEVILAALRRLVLRWRGLPAPVPVPALRPVRVMLAPVASLRDWRRDVLDRTAPARVELPTAPAPVTPEPVPTPGPADRPGEPATAPGAADNSLTERPVRELPAPAGRPPLHLASRELAPVDHGDDGEDQAAGEPGEDATKRAHIVHALTRAGGDVREARRLLAARGVHPERGYVYRVRRSLWPDTPADTTDATREATTATAGG